MSPLQVLGHTSAAQTNAAVSTVMNAPGKCVLRLSFAEEKMLHSRASYGKRAMLWCLYCVWPGEVKLARYSTTSHSQQLHHVRAPTSRDVLV